MTTIFYAQIVCEQPKCKARYPEQPSIYDSAAQLETAGGRPSTVKTTKTLRVDAASMGWEVKRGAHGRDLCPTCRIREIESQSGRAPAADGTHTEGAPE